jgi:hypothetical protein
LEIKLLLILIIINVHRFYYVKEIILIIGPEFFL